MWLLLFLLLLPLPSLPTTLTPRRQTPPPPLPPPSSSIAVDHWNILNLNAQSIIIAFIPSFVSSFVRSSCPSLFTLIYIPLAACLTFVMSLTIFLDTDTDTGYRLQNKLCFMFMVNLFIDLKRHYVRTHCYICFSAQYVQSFRWIFWLDIFHLFAFISGFCIQFFTR